MSASPLGSQLLEDKAWDSCSVGLGIGVPKEEEEEEECWKRQCVSTIGSTDSHLRHILSSEQGGTPPWKVVGLGDPGQSSGPPGASVSPSGNWERMFSFFSNIHLPAEYSIPIALDEPQGG